MSSAQDPASALLQPHERQAMLPPFWTSPSPGLFVRPADGARVELTPGGWICTNPHGVMTTPPGKDGNQLMRWMNSIDPRFNGAVASVDPGISGAALPAGWALVGEDPWYKRTADGAIVGKALASDGKTPIWTIQPPEASGCKSWNVPCSTWSAEEAMGWMDRAIRVQSGPERLSQGLGLDRALEPEIMVDEPDVGRAMGDDGMDGEGEEEEFIKPKGPHASTHLRNRLKRGQGIVDKFRQKLSESADTSESKARDILLAATKAALGVLIEGMDVNNASRTLAQVGQVTESQRKALMILGAHVNPEDLARWGRRGGGGMGFGGGGMTRETMGISAIQQMVGAWQTAEQPKALAALMAAAASAKAIGDDEMAKDLATQGKKLADAIKNGPTLDEIGKGLVRTASNNADMQEGFGGEQPFGDDEDDEDPNVQQPGNLMVSSPG